MSPLDLYLNMDEIASSLIRAAQSRDLDAAQKAELEMSECMRLLQSFGKIATTEIHADTTRLIRSILDKTEIARIFFSAHKSELAKKTTTNAIEQKLARAYGL